MTSAAAPTVFVIDDDALVRPAIQGLLKSAGLRSETYETPQDFSRSNRLDGPRRVFRDLAERDRMQCAIIIAQTRERENPQLSP